ncbi:hypothetical protein RI129_009436 [Pyrocoelia pectoralis]|uniref:Protein-lysine N-methyltransferase SMYD4 n=1 Tax=Pyrocoelia pectoralis TaxID=417401 RepID=A0AAN7VBM3_9COLE
MSEKFTDKDYYLRCSEKTLQTNEKGFFLQFSDHVSEIAGTNWINNTFGKLKSDRERIDLIYKYKPVKEAICEALGHVQDVYRKKNAELSKNRRLEVEKLLEKQEYNKALILACQSVLRAPPTGDNHKVDDGFTLSLAYWTRATVLMELRRYAWALLDLQAALKEGVSDDMKVEAFIKMGVCYKGMNELNRAKISFTLAERMLGTDAVKLKSLESYKTSTFKEVREVDRRVLPSPAASVKIELKEEKGKGRFVVAKDEVKTGDTLVVEEPLVASLLPDCFSTHCHHCFDRLLSPVGCNDCASIAFCKRECRDVALASYHKYECHILDLLIGSGMSVLCHLALRMVTQLSLKESLAKYEDKRPFCTNSHLRLPEDFLQRTLMTAFLLRCLQKSNYFIDGEANDDVVPNEEELKIGELLLYYLEMLQFNAHEIYETRYDNGNQLQNSKFGYIGVALYPTASLFNHDCYPAVTRHFVGKKIVVTAVRPLKAGETIGDNYGPIFTRKSLISRQKVLSSRYWFDCRCEACTQDWPSFDNGLQKVSDRLRCPNDNCTNFFTLPLTKENLKCPRCKKNVSLTDYLEKLRGIQKKYEKAHDLVNDAKTDEAAVLLCEGIDTFHKISRPPHAITHVAQEVLLACLAHNGNSYVRNNIGSSP